jgi:HD-like signal output (HDOD) protein
MDPSALTDPPNLDKKGADLDRQRFRMLEDIAQELSSEVVFPSSFDTVVRLRKALQDPALSIAKIADVIALEPLVAARVLSLANSALYSRHGSQARDLRHAIERIGVQAVRTAAMAIAMRQLVMARDVPTFRRQSNDLWRHSLHTAAAAYVVARRMSRVNPEEAQLAGMIHDIGAFYMLYRAAHYEELVQRPDSANHLVVRWHESIGHSVAIALGLPEDMAEAVADHDHPRPFADPPQTLADVVRIANRLAGGLIEWGDMPVDEAALDEAKLAEIEATLGEEIQAHAAAMTAVFAG